MAIMTDAFQLYLLAFQMADAPSAHRGKLGEAKGSDLSDADLEKQLAALKAL